MTATEKRPSTPKPQRRQQQQTAPVEAPEESADMVFRSKLEARMRLVRQGQVFGLIALVLMLSTSTILALNGQPW